MSYGQGSTIAEAAEQIRRATNYPHEYAGGKTVIFTRAYAEHGTYGLFDFYGRDQKPSLRQYIFVLDSPTTEILDLELEEEQFLGLYLYEMLNTTKHSLGIISTQSYQFIEATNTGSRTVVVPIIKIRQYEEEKNKPKEKKNEQGDEQQQGSQKDEQQGGDKQEGQTQQKQQQGKLLNNPHIIVDGSAVFVGGKMEQTLSDAETNAFNLLDSPVIGGLLESPNPEHPKDMVGYSIIKSKPKRKLELIDSRIKLYYTVNLRVVLLDSTTTLSSDLKETQEAIKKSLADRLRSDTISMYNRMKEDGIDILNVKRDVDIRFCSEMIENPLDITDFDVKFNIALDGTGKIRHGLV